ncbi:ferritin-like fold-containing protein [Nocardioides sp. GCM10027113]|uniref:ferritin-like fold-containing protein n=1 Tax=unclassified Nocardioides TaxID=2615069 RepID=UPI00361380A4
MSESPRETESADDSGAPSASPSSPPAGDPSLALEDVEYRAAVVDLLGAIAYGEISAFERLAEDAKLAPSLEDKLAIASMAAAELGHVTLLRDRLTELGADPYAAMAPFQEPIELFHAHTAPSDWYEGLVKAFVGDGLAADFYREIAAYLDVRTRDVVVASLEDSGHSSFVVDRVRAAIEQDPRLGGRLALWGRRLMGEALTQAQRVAGERDALSALLAGGIDRPGLDLAAIGRMFARITERHAARMTELGLDA